MEKVTMPKRFKKGGSTTENKKQEGNKTSYEAQKKYDKSNTRFIGLKLNKKTDFDILLALEGKPMQTEIKRLIRKGLKAEE